MRSLSLAVMRSLIRGIVLIAITTALVQPPSLLRAQLRQAATRPDVRLPDEAAGLDAIARTLIAAFNQVDIVALGEAHDRKVDADLRLTLVRHPDFAKRVKSIVIECASATEQPTLDRYIRGESVAREQLQRVWQLTAETTNGFCDAPIYPEFLAAVRDVNSKLTSEARIRVLAGHPGPGGTRGIEAVAASALKEPVLLKRGKALLIYGAAHFYLTGPPSYLASMGDGIGLAKTLDIDFPGRWLAVIPVGGLSRPPAVKADAEPDYSSFDRAVKSRARPVLVSLRRSPFRDFTAEAFLGRTLTNCRGPEGCRSVFKGSTLTLGLMADAAIYVGREPAAGEAKPAKFE